MVEHFYFLFINLYHACVFDQVKMSSMKRDSYETNIRVALSTTHLIGARPLYISRTCIKKEEQRLPLR
jgi:hypothetical protein